MYYVRMRGKIMGPFALDKLRAMRDSGQVGRFQEVSADKVTWQPVDKVLGISVPTAPAGNVLDAIPVAPPIAPPLQEAVVSRVPLAPPVYPPPPPPLTPTIGGATGEGKTVLGQVVLPGASLPEWHYADSTGNQCGPVSLDQLAQFVQQGQLRGGDLVWHSSLPEWQPVSTIPELAAFLRPSGVHPLAIVSLILGFVWIGGIGSLAAIILGVLALYQLRDQRGGGKALALAGIIVGGIMLIVVTPLIYYFWLK